MNSFESTRTAKHAPYAPTRPKERPASRTIPVEQAPHRLSVNTPELSNSGSQCTGTLPHGTPWRSTPSCHPYCTSDALRSFFFQPNNRNEGSVPFPLPFSLLLPRLSLHIVPSLLFLRGFPLLSSSSLLPPPLRLPLALHRPVYPPLSLPRGLLSPFSPLPHCPFRFLSRLTRPHALLPPFMARSCPGHPCRIGSATWFLRRGRQYPCQRHDGVP